MNVAESWQRRVGILHIRALHQFKSGATLGERKNVCAQTSTGIVVLLVAAGIEIVDEELARLLQIPAKKGSSQE